MGSKTLLGLAAALLIGACGGASLDVSATGGEIPIDVPGITLGLVTFNDVVINVNAANETSVAEISFSLNSQTKTAAGTAVDEGVQFTFTTLDSGVYGISTTWGGFAFTLNEDGTLSTTDPDLSISGNQITIQNTAGFTELTIDAVNDTSVNEMAYLLTADNASGLPANRQIGAIQTIPGSDVQDGVTYAFEGMVPGQRFQLRTMLGSALFVLDGSGALQPFFPAAGVFLTTSGSTITIQNTISYDPLKIPAVQDTTMAEVSYYLQTTENSFSFDTQDRQIGSTQTIAGTAVQTGVTVPFLGMTQGQSFLFRSSLGDIYFTLDEDGNFEPFDDDTSPDRFDFSEGVMTLNNKVNHILKVYFQFPDDAVESTQIDVYGAQAPQLAADRSIGSKVVLGTELTDGAEIEVCGLLHRTRVQADCDLSVVGPNVGIQYQPFLDGTALFGSGATVDSSTKAHLVVDPAPPSLLDANSYFLELAPKEANHPPVVDAGNNIKFKSSQQSSMVLKGTATDSDGDELTCRWKLGATVVAGPTVMTDETCDLNLANLDPLGKGEHIFTLCVTDGEQEVSDEVVVTVCNSSPIACASGAGVYVLTQLVRLDGQVYDDDPDVLTYYWRLNGNAVTPQSSRTGGADKGPIDIHARDVSAADFGPGVHVFELVVDDGQNEEVVDEMVVQIVENGKRVHCPTIHPCLLAPADGELHPVTLRVNAWDLADQPLDTTVTFTLGDGSDVPAGDIEVVSFDKPSGVMELKVRAVANEGGAPRCYFVRVTAVDGSGSESIVTLKLRVVPVFDDLR